MVARLGSEDLAAMWRPYLETCIEAFGPDRAMFESNFPVDKGSFSYATCWNAFKRLAAGGRAVKMLWQHDPAQPIGIWDEVREDATGLWVKGRLLRDVEKGREAAALLAAGAIDGLSIGYRTVKAERDGKGQRLLQELELWEVSLVTFPMLPEARVSAKGDTPDADIWRELAAIFDDAALSLAGR